MLYNVDVLYSDLYNVTRFEKLGGVLYKSVAHLGDMEKSVVVNSYINEATKVNDVSYRTRKLHIGLQIVYIKNVG